MNGPKPSGRGARVRHLAAPAFSLIGLLAPSAGASLVSGPDIIPAPPSVEAAPPGLTNLHQQAFDEQQGVTLPADIELDPGGVWLRAGTRVNSHMVLLNPPNGSGAVESLNQTWTFDGPIIGVLSDRDGTLEAATTQFLGAPGTVYPQPYNYRGLEHDNAPATQDWYEIDGKSLTLHLRTNGGGDWLRVITLPPEDVVMTDPRSILDLVEHADLVFRGQVLDVQYRMSSPDQQTGEMLPHTFVTYRVDETFRGDAPPELTLRFLGGLDAVSWLFLRISIVPDFRVGDSDVLFVRDNGSEICPLVGASRGRLRVRNDAIFSNGGHPMGIAADGGLLAMPADSGDPSSPSDRPRQAPSDPAAQQLPMSFANLAASIARVAPLSDPPGQFVSANPDLPFDGPDLTALAPPPPLPGEDVIDADPAPEAGMPVREP